jgi:hypothetical protein
LQREKLSPEQLHAKRTQLLNKQQLELSDVDKRMAEEQKEIERGALADWEVRFARAKLVLKEKHYKEFSDALREFSPDHDEVKLTDAKIQELEEVKRKLDLQRKETDAKLQEEQKAFEEEQRGVLEEELQSFNQQLEEETQREEEKLQRNIDMLNQRKEEMVKEKKQKVKVSLCKQTMEVLMLSTQELSRRHHLFIFSQNLGADGKIFAKNAKWEHWN